jgi:hypothetical protein
MKSQNLHLWTFFIGILIGLAMGFLIGLGI